MVVRSEPVSPSCEVALVDVVVVGMVDDMQSASLHQRVRVGW